MLHHSYPLQCQLSPTVVHHLAPENLNYRANPLVVQLWLEKFPDSLMVNNKPEGRHGIRRRNRLDTEYATNLKSLVDDWTDTMAEILTKAIQGDLLIQHPIIAQNLLVLFAIRCISDGSRQEILEKF